MLLRRCPLIPQEQMFYNSLKRKGKGADVKVRLDLSHTPHACACLPPHMPRDPMYHAWHVCKVGKNQRTPDNTTRNKQEKDVTMMVAIHNNMNERTWRDVIAWEKMHCKECNDPRLLRFVGKPDDFSPKARLRMLTGGSEPFDRHDWVVDRCGTEVRYIIDYYHDESAPVDKAAPRQHDLGAKTQVKRRENACGLQSSSPKSILLLRCAWFGLGTSCHVASFKVLGIFRCRAEDKWRDKDLPLLRGDRVAYGVNFADLYGCEACA